ncbi:hypothetical protein Droror1_Dr00003937 [Drosera rotundifolia]
MVPGHEAGIVVDGDLRRRMVSKSTSWCCCWLLGFDFGFNLGVESRLGSWSWWRDVLLLSWKVVSVMELVMKKSHWVLGFYLRTIRRFPSRSSRGDGGLNPV